MTARNFAMSHQFACCTGFAATGTSAAHKLILDTALAAVSVIIVGLIRLLALIG